MATLYKYSDVDGDRLAVFDALIPAKGKGVNIKTSPNGCSFPLAEIPALVEALSKAMGKPEAGAEFTTDPHCTADDPYNCDGTCNN